MSRHQKFLESQDSGETMERKFTTQYGLMYSDLVKITNYSLQTFDGADRRHLCLEGIMEDGAKNNSARIQNTVG